MSKLRSHITPEAVLLVLMALSMFAGLFALVFLKPSSAETRALVVIASSLLMIGGFASLMLVVKLKKRLRKQKWLSAVLSWSENSRAGVAPRFILPGNLSEQGLQQLAIRVFFQIGYRNFNVEGNSSYIRMVNPQGELELLACKQQSEVLDLHYVYSMQLEIKRVKAKRGFFLAPAGFTDETSHWVANRSIVLADRDGIRRLVDCARIRTI
ncbi:MAG: hypothetical protein JW862_16755 [Anaerolineales bacterium]|nr:hypothetical protein [Anaerolineales bacterium]